MNIYLIKARREAFRHCGLLPMPVEAFAAQAEAAKRAKALQKELKANGSPYKLVLSRVAVRAVAKDEVLRLLAGEDAEEVLVEDREVIREWSAEGLEATSNR